MPKSKRNRIVPTSKVEKKGKENTLKLYNAVQESADVYKHCFVFGVENMRNTYLKEIRSAFSETSRIFFGKTKVMAKALGTSVEEEHLPGLHKLTPYMNGTVGLLFTNQEPQEIIDYFGEYVQTDFARAGLEATRDFEIPEGIVYSRGGDIPVEDDSPLAHSLEPTLRKWGMPTRLVKGKISLDGPYTVCKEGKELNSNQTALLKMFGVVMADFKVQLKAYWSASSEEVVELESADE